MKEQVQLTGVRKWFGDDFLAIQNEIIAAQEAFFEPYGSCIIKGCEVSGQNIAAGIVYVGGKIARFYGATGVASFPVYLELQEVISNTRDYQTGGVKETEREYKAVLNTVVPAGDYITINSTGGKTFRDAFQDANNRMVKDSDISNWNRKEPGFAKKSAFNKDFGTVVGTVAEGNHLHDGKYLGLTATAENSKLLNGLTNQSNINDVTINRLMITGAFGLGAQNISTEVNINNYKVAGMYITPLTGLVNIPQGWVSKRYVLIVAGGSDYCMQIIGRPITNDIAIRVSNSNTWSNWSVLYTTDNNGAGSGLDADLLDGYNASIASVANTVVVRDTNQDITAHNFILGSDSRLKENIKTLDKGVDGLNPVSFNFIEGDKSIQYGFLAQDILKTHPELVVGTGKEKEDGSIDYYSIKQMSIIALNTATLQSQAKRIKKLEERLNNIGLLLNNK